MQMLCVGREEGVSDVGRALLKALCFFSPPAPFCLPPSSSPPPFKLDAGDFDTLEEVAADVALTRGSWDRYADQRGLA